MAKRRMFCPDVTYDDRFLDMSFEAQLLYFHVAMQADDDGFFPSPVRVARTIGIKSPRDTIRELETAGFIIHFESGIIAITHWNMNNQIRKDRYTKTNFRKEFRQLILEDNVYRRRVDDSQPDDNQMDTSCQPESSEYDTQSSIGQYRTDKDSTEQFNSGRKNGKRKGLSPISNSDCKSIFKKMLELQGREFPNAEYVKPIKTVRSLIVNYGLSKEQIEKVAVWQADKDLECTPSKLFDSAANFMRLYNQLEYDEKPDDSAGSEVEDE